MEINIQLVNENWKMVDGIKNVWKTASSDKKIGCLISMDYLGNEILKTSRRDAMHSSQTGGQIVPLKIFRLSYCP